MTGFQKQAYCQTCQRPTLHVRPNLETNKTLIAGHSIITVLTCGLWLPFFLAWAIYHGWSIGRQKFRCQFCGTAN